MTFESHKLKTFPIVTIIATNLKRVIRTPVNPKQDEMMRSLINFRLRSYRTIRNSGIMWYKYCFGTFHFEPGLGLAQRVYEMCTWVAKNGAETTVFGSLTGLRRW